jgi:hypothetical protein
MLIKLIAHSLSALKQMPSKPKQISYNAQLTQLKMLNANMVLILIKLAANSPPQLAEFQLTLSEIKHGLTANWNSLQQPPKPSLMLNADGD